MGVHRPPRPTPSPADSRDGGGSVVVQSFEGRHAADTCGANSLGMTGSLYVTGTHVASMERHLPGDGRDTKRLDGVAHAVARPVVDGLASSACGLLVTAIADMDWQAVRGVPRCDECERVAD